MYVSIKKHLPHPIHTSQCRSVGCLSGVKQPEAVWLQDEGIANLVPHVARWTLDSNVQKAVELLGSYPHVVFPPAQIPSAARTHENPRPHAVLRLTPAG